MSQIDTVYQRVERTLHLKGVPASGDIQVWVQPSTGLPGCDEGLVIACHIHTLHSTIQCASLLFVTSWMVHRAERVQGEQPASDKLQIH